MSEQNLNKQEEREQIRAGGSRTKHSAKDFTHWLTHSHISSMKQALQCSHLIGGETGDQNNSDTKPSPYLLLTNIQTKTSMGIDLS